MDVGSNTNTVGKHMQLVLFHVHTLRVESLPVDTKADTHMHGWVLALAQIISV